MEPSLSFGGETFTSTGLDPRASRQHPRFHSTGNASPMKRKLRSLTRPESRWKRRERADSSTSEALVASHAVAWKAPPARREKARRESRRVREHHETVARPEVPRPER